MYSKARVLQGAGHYSSGPCPSVGAHEELAAVFVLEWFWHARSAKMDPFWVPVFEHKNRSEKLMADSAPSIFATPFLVQNADLVLGLSSFTSPSVLVFAFNSLQPKHVWSTAVLSTQKRRVV